jgi:hypothetical protein
VPRKDPPPIRIQKRRVAGWKGDRDPVYVGRGTVWGNPYRLGTHAGLARVPAADLETPWEYEGRVSADGADHEMCWPSGMVTHHTVRYMTRDEIVQTHRSALLAPRPGLALVYRHRGKTHRLTEVTVDLVRERLAGRDLSCWCKPNESCHADILLWVANTDEDEVRAAVAQEKAKARAYAARLLALHPELAPREKELADA